MVSNHLNVLLLFVQQLSNLVHSKIDPASTSTEKSRFMETMDTTIHNLLQKVENIIVEQSDMSALLQGHGTRISNAEKSIERLLMDDVVPDSSPLHSMHHWSQADISRVLHRLDNADAKTANHEVLLVEMNAMVQEKTKHVNVLETQLRNANEEIRKLQRRMEILEYNSSLRNIATADLE